MPELSRHPAAEDGLEARDAAAVALGAVGLLRARQPLRRSRRVCRRHEAQDVVLLVALLQLVILH
eukprot:4137326-Prymnesium_polylepis.1